jgi:uroporphyrinogen decarboxylase
VASLKRHFQTKDWSVVLQALGIEGWAELTPELRRPVRWIDDRTHEDSWGVRFRFGEAARYQEWLSGPLQKAESTADVAHYHFPTTTDIRDPVNYAARVAQLKRDGNFVSGGIENPFKRLWHLRGYENALMDYLANLEVLEAIYDKLFALAAETSVRMTRAGVDMIKVVGDVAMQDRIIMGPDPWRKVDKPRFAALIAACRVINPQVRFFFHSDGKLTDLMDDLIEVGFTVINPIQPECMDPLEVKRRWGRRITLHGCISLQRTLPFGTVADVRAEVETLIRECGRDGGLVLMPSNVIQPDSPIENIIACYHTVRDFDLAGLEGS